MKYLILLFVLCAVGCGGSGGGGNPGFVGHFIGPWSGAAGSGTMDVVISHDGKLDGTLVDPNGPDGVIHGDCDLSGDLGNQGTVQFEGGQAIQFSGNFISHENGKFIAAEINFESAPDFDCYLERQ